MLRPLSAAGALLVAVAGCQPQTTGPTADRSATQTAQPAAAAGIAAPVVEERLTTVNCRTPAQGRVHFRVGNAVFAVPGDDVRTVVPPGATPATDAAEVVQRLRARTAEGAGCPESPLDAALLGIAGPAGEPLLAEAIALFTSPPGAIATPYAELARQMLANRERCRQAEGGLIACPAIEQEGPQQMQSLYLVSTDPGRTLAFGGPLAVRCVLAEDRIRSCEIVDELPGGVGLRAPLEALPTSSDALAAAHRAAITQVRSLRL